MNEGPRRFTYANVMSTLAVFLALTGGSIAIASVGKNDVGSPEVKDDTLKSKDLKKDEAVKSSDVVDDTLEGEDVEEQTLNNIGVDSLATFPHARATAGGVQSFEEGMVTQVAFDNANPLGRMDFDATADKLTATVDGIYTVIGEIGWAANATGRRVVQIRVNGTIEAADSEQAVDSTTASTRQNVATVLRLDDGDELTLYAQQSGSGGDLFTSASQGDFAALSATWVSQP